MSLIPELTAKHDLRSIDRDIKRDWDLICKWVNGGMQFLAPMDPFTMPTRYRPRRSRGKLSHDKKRGHNVNKMRVDSHGTSGRSWPVAEARMQASELPLSQSSAEAVSSCHQQASRDSSSESLPHISEGRSHSMALEVFVKTDNRETEKLVEREYEILNSDGEALKGRKARKNLRGEFGTGNTQTALEEEDGFVLI